MSRPHTLVPPVATRQPYGYGRMAGIHVELHSYNSEWPVQYEMEASRISRVLGDRVRYLAHVGSTAVPGLAAKPLIDIVLCVEDSADEDSYAPALERLGYQIRVREPEWFEHRVFRGPAEDINLHVFTQDASEVERMVRFRDRLRTDEKDRKRYEDRKRALATREWESIQDYADAKSGIVEQILANT